MNFAQAESYLRGKAKEQEDWIKARLPYAPASYASPKSIAHIASIANICLDEELASADIPKDQRLAGYIVSLAVHGEWYCIPKDRIEASSMTDMADSMTVGDIVIALPVASFTLQDGTILTCVCDGRVFSVMRLKDGRIEASQCGMNELCKDAPDFMRLAMTLMVMISSSDLTLAVPQKLTKKMKALGVHRPPVCRELKSVRYDANKHNGGTHASPRQHWRRGHIRNARTKDGHRPVWIKPVLVAIEKEGER